MELMINEIKTKVTEIFSHLHQNPEISWKEFETTKYLETLLKEHGYKTTTFKDCTGVVGEIGSGKPVVAVRADMDALWQEVDGQFCGNHSCGHDAHMTMALGVLLTLEKMNFTPKKGTLKLLFQPAEEMGEGALKMIEKKVLDDVDYLYGVHLRPIQEVENGKASPAIIHGAALFMKLNIIGTDTHGARPHLGTNAIEVGMDILSQIKGIHLNPMVPYTIKPTQFTAGGENANTIPGSAQFSLDLRAQTNHTMNELVEKAERIVKSLAEFHDVDIQISYEGRVVAAEVSEEAQAIMAESIAQSIGEENLVSPVITSGGEDFHFYTIERPHLKATMLGLGCDLKPGLHHPHMSFDRDAMLKGIEILTRTVQLTFKKLEGEGNVD
ncbi:M20 peptidase aminoacylase family protein [Bacillus sp. FJAT-45350]|uniref:M20 peptidase aminoacylase family protein n=1 Tax=Bacillus sp. FJAT-45350 TaxID=2011014 RepID=UPI000BB96E94|nr:M20 peptidase aminoacylase family protein [Bacillus sp. FJAT-45350]